ncbi:sensor histidine kinase [Cumulibacter manganitolerans]|uniref:sensor histidine kinase n=1 Tax=Cumulibacter manganitolerans TaxID=1884992 RepID=UPI001295764E|nr:sensor histidine kinase [Cumulibacter manganitolerans]
MLKSLRTATDEVLAVSRAMLVAIALVLALLLAFPVVEALLARDESAAPVVTLAVVEVLIGIGGAVVLHRHGELVDRPASALRWRSALWLIALCLPWAGLIVLTRQAAYLGFVLYFLSLWLLPPAIGTATAITLAVLTGLGQSVHHGWTSAAFIGPIASAGILVAVMIGLRAVIAQSTARAELIEALESAQARLVESERSTGRLAERARLGRELHDTVAQHLSSIQLLVHAAERDADPAAREQHLQAARDAASSALGETRAFIADLTPAPLAGRSLVTALERVAAQPRGGLRVTTRIAGHPRTLPTAIEATLLRIAQESLANVAKHAEASTATVVLQYGEDDVLLEIGDDGRGFDSDRVLAPGGMPDGSFGISGMRARAAELGGYLAVVGEPGEGTLVSVQVPVPPGDPGRGLRS